MSFILSYAFVLLINIYLFQLEVLSLTLFVSQVWQGSSLSAFVYLGKYLSIFERQICQTYCSWLVVFFFHHFEYIILLPLACKISGSNPLIIWWDFPCMWQIIFLLPLLKLSICLWLLLICCVSCGLLVLLRCNLISLLKWMSIPSPDLGNMRTIFLQISVLGFSLSLPCVRLS